jgi:hypothetical protein
VLDVFNNVLCCLLSFPFSRLRLHDDGKSMYRNNKNNQIDVNRK